MAVGPQDPCLSQRALLLVRDLFLVQCLVLYAVVTQSHWLAILLMLGSVSVEVASMGFMAQAEWIWHVWASSVESACAGFMA